MDRRTLRCGQRSSQACTAPSALRHSARSRPSSRVATGGPPARSAAEASTGLPGGRGMWALSMGVHASRRHIGPEFFDARPAPRRGAGRGDRRGQHRHRRHCACISRRCGPIPTRARAPRRAVGRNVAENLVAVVPTALCTGVGDDAFGAELLRGAAATGMDVSASAASAGPGHPSYSRSTAPMATWPWRSTTWTSWTRSTAPGCRPAPSA